ncbi:MAG: hypothetical protein HYU81_02850 [Candidatus Brennerbacteria bacterium]|nr:hypothetical protein [Candidatus Brennerbacteria bacterium]
MEMRIAVFVLTVFLLVVMAWNIVSVLRFRREFRRKCEKIEGVLNGIYRAVSVEHFPKLAKNPKIATSLILEALAPFMEANGRGTKERTLGRLLSSGNIPAAKKFLTTLVRRRQNQSAHK